VNRLVEALKEYAYAEAADKAKRDARTIYDLEYSKAQASHDEDFKILQEAHLARLKAAQEWADTKLAALKHELRVKREQAKQLISDEATTIIAKKNETRKARAARRPDPLKPTSHKCSASQATTNYSNMGQATQEAFQMVDTTAMEQDGNSLTPKADIPLVPVALPSSSGPPTSHGQSLQGLQDMMQMITTCMKQVIAPLEARFEAWFESIEANNKFIHMAQQAQQHAKHDNQEWNSDWQATAGQRFDNDDQQGLDSEMGEAEGDDMYEDPAIMAEIGRVVGV
jgi:hypothetical protein